MHVSIKQIKSYNDLRVIAITLLVAISTVVLQGTGLLFYIVLSISCVLVILAVFESNPSYSLLLFLVFCIGAINIGAQVLTAGFYADTADTIWHTAFIQSVADTNNLTGIEVTRYKLFLPIFHVFGGIGVLLTELPARDFIGIAFVILFPAAALLLFITWKKWTSSRIALIAMVLLVSNTYFIFWGSKVHPQSLSFVLFILILALVTFPISYRTRTIGLLSFVCSIWYLTHHLSVVMGLVLLLPVFTGSAIFHFRQGKTWKEAFQLSRWNHYIILFIVFLSYWTIVTTLIMSPFHWIFGYSPAAQGESSHLLSQSYTNISILFHESVPYLLDYIHYGILISLVIYILYMLWTKNIKVNSYTVYISIIATAVAGIFYFPNPMWIPLRGIGVLLRWAIMTIPFIVVLPAIAIEYDNRITRSGSGLSTVMIGVLLLLFLTSIGTGITDPSIGNIAGYEKEPDRTISKDELATLYFLQERAVSTISAPSHMPTYLNWFGVKNEDSIMIERTAISSVPGHVIQHPGLSVYPWADKSHTITVNLEDEGFQKTTAVDNEDIDWKLDGSKIYSNGGMEVYYTSEKKQD